MNSPLPLRKSFTSAAAEPSAEAKKLGKQLLAELSTLYPDQNKILKLIEQGAYLEEKDERGNTPALRAAYLGYTKVIQALHAKGANLNARDIDGNTPVIWSVVQSHPDTLQALVDAGTWINLQAEIEEPAQSGDMSLPSFDEDGDEEEAGPSGGTLNNALIIAAYSNDLKSLDILIKANALLDEKNAEGSTALILAAYRGNVEAVRALIKAGALMDEQDQLGGSALIWAAREGHEEIVDILLAEMADINLCNHFGSSALLQAAISGHGRIVTKLLKAGIDKTLQTKKGKTADHYAEEAGHHDIAREIRNYQHLPELLPQRRKFKSPVVPSGHR